jgi:short-subunit dehydrogenase
MHGHGCSRRNLVGGNAVLEASALTSGARGLSPARTDEPNGAMSKILILGATSPIARALAMRFAAEGNSVFLAARDRVEAERLAADITIRTGTTAIPGVFDAAELYFHATFFEKTLAALGGLDGVIICFGTLGDETAAQTSPEEAVATVNQNFTGAVSLLTLAACHLEQQRSGFVVVIGSVAGERGRAKNYVYGSAKGALAIFAQGLRARMAGAGVQVLTVKLGTVDSRMTWGRDSRLVVAPEAAADKIIAAWRRKAEVVYVPWLWRPIMGVVRMIPERIFKRTTF